MSNHQALFERDLSTLRAALEERGYVRALAALDYALPFYDNKFRKDEQTPSFHHPVGVAINLLFDQTRIKKAGYNPEDVIAVGILHDVPEDHPELKLATFEQLFNKTIAQSSFGLSKIRDGIHIANAEYYGGLSGLEWIVKLADRFDNVETMVYLQPHKMAGYYIETKELLSAAAQAAEKYPEIIYIVQSGSMQIEKCLNIYENILKRFADGPAASLLVSAFQENGVISGNRVGNRVISAVASSKKDAPLRFFPAAGTFPAMRRSVQSLLDRLKPRPKDADIAA